MFYQLKTKNIEMYYPRCDKQVDTLQIALMCVRAADDIRIKYDYERDGWVVLQTAYNEDGEDLDDWAEVAFIKAWQRSEPKPA